MNPKFNTKVIEWEERLQYLTDEQLGEMEILVKIMYCRILDERIFRLKTTREEDGI